MALHEQCVGATDEWYTPPEVFAALGCSFTMDVSSPGPGVVPWIPTATHIKAGSLGATWDGFIWMNPPFGGRNGLVPWLEKFCIHGNGIALVPDRTSAPWWQQFDPRMDLTFFVAKKIKFIDGRTMKPGKSPAQGTTLWGIGPRAATALRHAEAKKFGILHAPASSAAA